MLSHWREMITVKGMRGGVLCALKPSKNWNTFRWFRSSLRWSSCVLKPQWEDSSSPTCQGPTVPQLLMGGCRMSLLQGRHSFIQPCNGTVFMIRLMHWRRVLFTSPTLKGICTLPHNRNWVAVASNNVFFSLVPGLICIPDYPFGKQQADFNFVSLLTKPEVILVLAQVHDECNKAATMSLFNSTLAKHVSLEEFEEIQIQTFTQVRECS